MISKTEITARMESIGFNNIVEINYDSNNNPIIIFFISIWYELMEEKNISLEKAIIKAKYDMDSVYNHINRPDLEVQVKAKYFYRIQNRKLTGHTYFDSIPYIDNEVTFNVNDMYADILRLVDLVD